MRQRCHSAAWAGRNRSQFEREDTGGPTGAANRRNFVEGSTYPGDRDRGRGATWSPKR